MMPCSIASESTELSRVSRPVSPRLRTLALLCTLAWSSPAWGAESDVKLAEVLFEQGRAAMLQKDYATACPKFAESQRLEPATGTLLNLAVCHEMQGRLATAWSEYKEVIALARKEANQQREVLASKRAGELEPRLSQLVVRVPDHARVPGLVVFVDGVRIGEPAWGVAAPADKGSHEIEARADGRVAWKSRIELTQAGITEVTVPALAVVPTVAHSAAIAPAPAPNALLSAPAAQAAPASSASGRVRVGHEREQPTLSRNTVGYTLVAGGLVFGGVAGYFGLRAASKWNERDDNCPQGRCNSAAVDASEDAHHAALVADVTAVISLFSLGVGGYMLLSGEGQGARKPASTATSVALAPVLRPGGASIGLQGSF